MKVILNQDVKNVGKAGDVLSVKDGFARNFLIPRKLAEIASKGRSRYWDHVQSLIGAKKAKAQAERKELVTKLHGLSLTFQGVSAPNSEKIFGSITTHDISEKLETLGYQIDRRDIHLEDIIKTLGTFKATIKLGEGLQTDIQVVVERQQG
jgi:large subunit ribosomal protein L9